MRRVVINRFGSNLDISPDGKSRLPDGLRELLAGELTYTHVLVLRGREAYDEFGSRRPVRTQRKTMFTYDGWGRMVCKAGFLPRLQKFMSQNGYEVIINDKTPPHPRPDRYDLDWDAVFSQFEPRARQDEALFKITTNDHGVIEAPTGFGKAQPLNAQVQTPQGPRRIGDLSLGDDVCTPYGGVTQVVGIHPHGAKAVYAVRFDDNSVVECCEDHLWQVSSSVRGWTDRVVDTGYLVNNVTSPAGRSQLTVALPAPIAMQQAVVAIPPYIMGMLLGDGCFRSSSVLFTNADEAAVNKVASTLPMFMRVVKVRTTKYDWSIRAVRRYGRNAYKHALKAFGLYGLKSPDKFIPEAYLYNSVENRLELVRGLLDSDGYASKSGSVSLSTSSYKLAVGFQWLIESLGGVCKIRVKKTTHLPSYRCSVYHHNPAELFSLPRKRARCIVRTKYRPKRTIRSVTYLSDEPMRCITVAHPSGLYLTDHCVVTHNSYMFKMVAAVHPKANILIVVSRQDVALDIHRDLTRYFPNVGMIGAGRKRKGRLTVCMAQSLQHAGYDDWDIILGDEAHELGATTVVGHLAKMKWSRNFGFSASPWGRNDGTSIRIQAIFGDTIFYMSYPDAVALGLVVPIRVEWLDVIMEQNPVADYEDVPRFRHGLWRNDYRNQVIAAKAQSYGPDEQVLIMVAHFEHAVYLKHYLPEFTLCYAERAEEDKLFARAVRDGLLPADEPRMTDRRRMLLREQFEEGELKKVIATDVWSTGVNFQQLQVLIRADARSSSIKDTQIPGRVSRTHSETNKQVGILVDCLDQFDPGFRDSARKRRRDYQQKGWEQVMPTAGPRLLQQ